METSPYSNAVLFKRAEHTKNSVRGFLSHSELVKISLWNLAFSLKRRKEYFFMKDKIKAYDKHPTQWSVQRVNGLSQAKSVSL